MTDRRRTGAEVRHARCGKLWTEHAQVLVRGLFWSPVCDDEVEALRRDRERRREQHDQA